ncbi:hypothetical protein II941_04080 [bacterium]|nr:hypothetical protein [bacterium]
MQENSFEEILIDKNSTDEILKKIIKQIQIFFKNINKFSYSDNGNKQTKVLYDVNKIVDKVTLSDTNNINSFQYYISKRINSSIVKQLDIDKITDNETLLIFLNAYLNLLKSFLDFLNNMNCKIPVSVISKIRDEYDSSNIKNLLNCLPYKNFNFNKMTFFVTSQMENFQLEMLNEEKLNKHFQDFLSSTNIYEKEEKMHFFSNKIADTLNQLKNDKREKIEKYFNKEDIKNFILMCQGYFRHLKNQKLDNPLLSKYSDEWLSYENNPKMKLQIMNNLFSIYLTILTILKNADLLDDFLKNI